MRIKISCTAILLFLISCYSKKDHEYRANNEIDKRVNKIKIESRYTNDTIKKIKPINNQTDSLNQKIKGTWTDGSSDNATMQIEEKNIFYLEQNSSYKYFLNGDIIKINFPNYSYTATLSFKKDTLLMDSDEYGQSKFWKFRN